MSTASMLDPPSVLGVDGHGPGRPRLVFIANVDWFFLSHRGHLVRRALDEGFDVEVWCGDSGRCAEIAAFGARVVVLPLRRGGLRPLEELRLLGVLLRLMARAKPDVVHNVSIKPVLYGTFAARLLRRPRVINAVSGFGYAVEGADAPSMLSWAVLVAYRVILDTDRAVTVFQNPDALSDFVRRGLVRANNATEIRGAGVDLDRFRYRPEPSGVPVVMFASRMLWDKGLREFVDAARRLRTIHQARFVLVGAPDPENRASVPRAWLEGVAHEGVCEWWGHRGDMAQVLAQANLVVLPSYHEGLPKVLLEAAAVGRSVIASDIAGCRAVVDHGRTGLLVPPRDTAALADAISHELEHPAERAERGRAAASKATAYGIAPIQAAFVNLWKAGPAPAVHRDEIDLRRRTRP